MKVAIEKFLREILNILNVIFDPQYCMEESKFYFNNEGGNQLQDNLRNRYIEVGV